MVSNDRPLAFWQPVRADVWYLCHWGCGHTTVIDVWGFPLDWGDERLLDRTTDALCPDCSPTDGRLDFWRNTGRKRPVVAHKGKTR